MREIKFRVWDGSKMWSWEDITKDKEILCSVMRNEFYATIPPKYFWQRQQYTGLKDKNGVEIYEGDIVEYTQHMFNTKMTRVKQKEIKYEEYSTRFNVYETEAGQSDHKVIGNIFEGVGK